MPDAPEPDSTPFLRRILPYLSIAILFAALYVGWTFYSRWSAATDAKRASDQKEVADAKKLLSVMGGGEFKILNFYAAPGYIRRGATSNVCYGVSEAKSVRIEPPVEQLKPVFSHCFQVAPKRTTEYKLIAEDGKGHIKSESFTIIVQ